MERVMISARITLWAERFVAAVTLMFAFLMPKLISWYTARRAMPAESGWAVMLAFYCSAVISAVALGSMDRLLKSVLAGQVFISANVKRIHRIRWCCGGVSLVCVPATVFYLPLIFVVVIMGFLFLAMSVTADVMAAAVAIREENDLTV